MDTVVSSEAAASRKLTIQDVVHHAKTLVRAEPSTNMWKIVRRYAEEFDSACGDDCRAALHLFSFHVAVPETHRTINYIDVQHDHGAFDYQKLAAHWAWAGSNFNRDCRQFFVTGKSSPEPQSNAAVSVIKLDTDDRAPMLERVKAMAGYVESRAFNQNTVFLDTDAFANRPLLAIFDGRFDVGVTFRTTAGYMPLNEGVIFCSVANRDAVRRFFSSYIATYEGLIQDPLISDYYGNIERWRGGQLSLNAIACPAGDITRIGTFDSHGLTVGLLPCTSFNYWVKGSLPPGSRSWDRKFVLHLKGDSKRLVDEVIEYQTKRIRTLGRRIS